MTAKQPKSKTALPEALKGHIFERPLFLDNLKGRGEISNNIVVLGEALKSIGSSETVVFTLKDFENKFKVTDGRLKQRVQYIKTQLKVLCQLHKVKSFVDYSGDNVKIYFWSTKV